jgi:regulator of sirC expression with transglutaminase-like and TPR domain
MRTPGGDTSLSQHPFDLLVELHAEHIRLDCAALQFARDAYPYLDMRRYLSRLDALAEEVAALRPGLASTLRYQAMRQVLVEEHGLRGNAKGYYDPQNSYLNRVLERGVGIPISLSVIWMEVGRRLKWPVSGIALPSHFIVRFDDPERFVLADPFSGGQSLSVDDCRRLVAANVERPVHFSRRLLRPITTRGVLARMLGNLREIYLAMGSWGHLLDVLQRLVALEPHQGRHLQDLAAVYARLGDVRGAYGYLRLYLRRAPHARDQELVEGNIKRLEAAIVALN